MRVTVNHIPKNWNYKDKISFMLWMQKIKNINYSKIK